MKSSVTKPATAVEQCQVKSRKYSNFELRTSKFEIRLVQVDEATKDIDVEFLRFYRL